MLFIFVSGFMGRYSYGHKLWVSGLSAEHIGFVGSESVMPYPRFYLAFID